MDDIMKKWTNIRFAEQVGQEKIRNPNLAHLYCGEGCFFTYDLKPNGFGGKHVVKLTFHNPDARIHRKITNAYGEFLDFPGYADGEWRDKAVFSTYPPKMRFLFTCKPFEAGKMELYWTFQPDGRYYEDDDGFGGTPEDEIQLVTVLDSKGSFLQSFQEESDFKKQHS